MRAGPVLWSRLSERTAVLSELHALNELRAMAAASEGEV